MNERQNNEGRLFVFAAHLLFWSKNECNFSFCVYCTSLQTPLWFNNMPNSQTILSWNNTSTFKSCQQINMSFSCILSYWLFIVSHYGKASLDKLKIQYACWGLHLDQEHFFTQQYFLSLVCKCASSICQRSLLQSFFFFVSYILSFSIQSHLHSQSHVPGSSAGWSVPLENLFAVSHHGFMSLWRASPSAAALCFILPLSHVHRQWDTWIFSFICLVNIWVQHNRHTVFMLLKHGVH